MLTFPYSFACRSLTLTQKEPTMPRLTHDDLWFCIDCTYYVANGPADDTTPKRDAEIAAGVSRLQSQGGYVVPNNDSETGEGQREFSSRWCDCCNSHLAGSRHRHAIIAP